MNQFLGYFMMKFFPTNNKKKMPALAGEIFSISSSRKLVLASVRHEFWKKMDQFCGYLKIENASTSRQNFFNF